MHHCHHHINYQSFNSRFLIAIVINVLFVICEILYAKIANSTILLADAGHNFGDIVGLLISWIANYLLTLPSKKRYSYGFKKASVFASLANALLLTATSVLISLEAINKFHNASVINEQMVINVALLGILINGSTALLFKQGAQYDLNLKSAFVHLSSDAFIAGGVVISNLLILYTKQVWLDPLISLIIVMIILYSTIKLLINSVNLLIDAIPYHIDFEGVQNYLNNLPGVSSIHDLHIWALSTQEVALTSHLIMPHQKLTDADLINIKSHLQHEFNINHVTLQIEQGDGEHMCQSC